MFHLAKTTWRGVISMLGAYSFMLGYWWCRSIKSLQSPERMNRGCVFILPGIQGKSPMEFSVARGLVDGDVPLGIEVFDWTTRLWPLFLFHLRAGFWQRWMAKRLAAKITDYQRRYPNRPVILIGHSGGGAVSLRTAEHLPQENRLAGVILLAPAISPFYDVRPALQSTAEVWNFFSPLDALFLGVGTLAAGTCDGWHLFSAGASGFLGRSKARPGLHQAGYRPEMLTAWNGGGHFGCVNRVFVGSHIAPLVQRLSEQQRKEQQAKQRQAKVQSPSLARAA